MPRPLALICAAALALSGCVNLPLRSTWAAQAPSLAGPDPGWILAGSLAQDDLEIQARNDDDFLYLRLASTAEHVKDQWMGIYGQSLLIFFDPDGRHPREDGLRLSLEPPAGLPPPWNAAHEPDYVVASADRLEHVHRMANGLLEPLPIRPQDVDWEMHFEGHRFCYVLRIPLSQPQGWNLGLVPGRRLRLDVETTPVDPHVALAFRPAKDSRVKAGGLAPPKAPDDPSAGTSAPTTSLPNLHLLAQDQAGDGSIHAMDPNKAPYQVPDPLAMDLWLQLSPEP